MELSIESFTHQGRPGLRLSGRLNGITAPLLERQLQDAGLAPDWWDVTTLHFLSSAGVRVLLAHEKRRRKWGAPASTLVGVQPAVRAVLDLSGLLEFWTLLPAFPAGDAAVAAPATPRIAPDPAGGQLVCWREAGGEGASLASLPLAFGRAGLGVTREVAARRPFDFLTLGNLLALRDDDGESDTFHVAEPASRFLRLEQAWLLAGEPAARHVLQHAAAWSALPGVGTAGWLGALALMPRSGGGVEVVLAVRPPAEAGDPEAIDGVRLSVPTADWATLLDGRPVRSAIESIASAVERGPERGVPSALPAGTLLWVWEAATPTPAAEYSLAVEAPGADDATELLIRTLYADCRRVRLTRLSGGFSAATWLVDSEDAAGRHHLPTVLKVGPPAMMNRENAAHEAHVRPFILNNASVALGDARQGDAVGLRYNFVGITGDSSDLRTLARRWEQGEHAAVTQLFGRLARETLRPWYGQARRRRARLYADHSPLRLFTGLLEVARAFVPELYAPPRLPCAALGRDLPNPWRFLEERWTRLDRHELDCPMAITHGDLNLNNLLSDSRGNLYVIDFSETRERSVASDFARNEPVFLLERAILETPEDEAAFLREAARLYSAEHPWHMLPEDLATVDAARLAFLREGRQLAYEHLGPDAPLQAWLLPVMEWTLPITLFGNLPERKRRLATWVAALQLERLQLVAQEAAQDLA